MFRHTEVKFVFAAVWFLDLGDRVTSETIQEMRHTLYHKVTLTE